LKETRKAADVNATVLNALKVEKVDKTVSGSGGNSGNYTMRESQEPYNIAVNDPEIVESQNLEGVKPGDTVSQGKSAKVEMGEKKLKDSIQKNRKSKDNAKTKVTPKKVKANRDRTTSVTKGNKESITNHSIIVLRRCFKARGHQRE
jgi:hypothetical protein